MGHANESDWNLKILGLLSMARRAQQINGGSARSKCFPSCGRYSTTIVRSTCQVQLPNFLTPCPARHLCNGTGDAYLCSYSLSYSLQMQLQLAPQGVPLKFGVQLILSGKQATWPGCSKSSWFWRDLVTNSTLCIPKYWIIMDCPWTVRIPNHPKMLRAAVEGDVTF